MKCSLMVAVALTAATGLATAADFSAEFVSFAGTGGISVDGAPSIPGGLITMQYVGGVPAQAVGQFGGPTFTTFCIEVDQRVGSHDYDIVSLAAAPNPPTGDSNPNAPASYGGVIAGRIHEVIAAAIDAGWIQSDLALGIATNNQLAAVQALVWDAIYGPGDVTANAAVTAEMAFLMTNYWAAGSTVAGLRAMVSSSGQDMLFVVPLPPAAFAGLATLFGVAGVARLRRR